MHRLLVLTLYAHKHIIQDPNHKIIVNEIQAIKELRHKVNFTLEAFRELLSITTLTGLMEPYTYESIWCDIIGYYY